MIIGIVGAEASKFTELGKIRAQQLILEIVAAVKNPITICSGHCHLGGVDIWAEEVAESLRLEKLIFPPQNLQWAPNGYQERNRMIASSSDIVHCIAVDKLPKGFRGMSFSKCYHCERAGMDPTNHVKSGGCYTMHHARQGKLHIVQNYMEPLG